MPRLIDADELTAWLERQAQRQAAKHQPHGVVAFEDTRLYVEQMPVEAFVVDSEPSGYEVRCEALDATARANAGRGLHPSVLAKLAQELEPYLRGEGGPDDRREDERSRD